MTHILNTIKKRRTIKQLSDSPLPTVEKDEAFITKLIEAAYWAPFHYPSHLSHKKELTSELPFRFYVLDSEHCRKIAKIIVEQSIDSGKLLTMLHSADYLILATWTPNPSDTDELFEPTAANMEHIAAAGAGIQNLLLQATELGRENYWGSGGILRKPEMFERIGIPSSEILLGSLFIFPDVDTLPEHVAVKTSPRRDSRGELDTCFTWVNL